jgi:hypothetical protein
VEDDMPENVKKSIKTNARKALGRKIRLQKELYHVQNIDLDTLTEWFLRDIMENNEILKSSQALVYLPHTDVGDTKQGNSDRFEQWKEQKQLKIAMKNVQRELVIAFKEASHQIDKELLELKKEKKEAQIQNTKADSDQEEEEEQMNDMDSSSEDEAPEFDPLLDAPAVQKNRPGQRARQKQWEKLYGEKANHVKKQKKEQPPKRDNFKRQGKYANSKRKLANANESPEKLHPSWKAKKEQKQKESAALLPPLGKKIKFDAE